MSRYKDTFQTIKGLQKDIITLQNLISNHSRMLTLRKILDISKTYERINGLMTEIEFCIDVDYQAKWITAKEAEELNYELDEAKSILNMLM